MVKEVESIVIGADHYNTLWLVRSLGMAKLHPLCIVVSDETNSFVCASKYCKSYYLTRTYEDALSKMLSINVRHRLPVIAAGDEAAAFIDRHYVELSEKYILHDCANQSGQILYWMDKARMLRQASASGLMTPYTRVLRFDEEDDLDDIPFPCLIKPEISAMASKAYFRVCNSLEELQKAISEVKGHCMSVILQTYIHPQFEYLVYGVRTKQNEIIIPGGLRKIHTCSDTNNMGMMSYACCSSLIPSQLKDFEKVKYFLNEIDYHGIFSIEFMITNDKAYFLEINLRNDGTVYCTTQSGVNIPALWAISAMGGDIAHIPRTYKRRETYCMNEVNYVKYTLFHQSIVKSVYEILQTKAFSLLKWNDLRPVVK